MLSSEFLNSFFVGGVGEGVHGVLKVVVRLWCCRVVEVGAGKVLDAEMSRS